MANLNQEELFKPDFGWFHFFRTIIQNNTWAKMSMASKAVYPVIKSYCNSDNGSAFPSYDTLVEKAGISRKTVTVALKELVELGLLTEKKTKGRVTIYSLQETFDVQHPISGRAGTASFDYVPGLVQKAVDEMKALITTGANGKIIQINFNLNCSGNFNTHGIHVEGISAKNGAADILEMLEEKERLACG